MARPAGNSLAGLVLHCLLAAPDPEAEHFLPLPTSAGRMLLMLPSASLTLLFHKPCTNVGKLHPMLALTKFPFRLLPYFKFTVASAHLVPPSHTRQPRIPLDHQTSILGTFSPSTTGPEMSPI